MYKTVSQTIYEMLTESTGKALCDSGGYYGRHWERNQKKTLQDFDNEKSVDCEIEEYDNELNYTISVYHYINNGLMLNNVCQAFNKINQKAKNWESEIYGVSKESYNFLKERKVDLLGKPFNSYNDESNLSQVILGQYIVINNISYVILLIHQGCDIRSGYTNARLFLLPDEFLPRQDVYGIIDGKQVSNRYDGVSMTDDETCKKVKVDKNSKIELYLSEV